MATIIDTTRPSEVAKLNGSSPHPPLGSGASERVTFPSSGITVTIRHISQMRVNDHRNAVLRMEDAQNKIPKPPVQIINIGGEDVAQPNPADPDYIAALDTYKEALGDKELEWFVSKTLDVDAEAVRAYREISLATDGTDYPDRPDWYIYLHHIVCLSLDDFDTFYRVATSMSRPTPAAIADAKDRFRGSLSRS